MSPGRTSAAPRLPRNDVRQYEGMADQWWQPVRGVRDAALDRRRPGGAAAAGAAARRAAGRPRLRRRPARPARRPAGLPARRRRPGPGLAALGRRARRPAGTRRRAAAADRGRAAPTSSSAGEILEHVPDLRAAVAEACRVLRPGGTLVLDTIARHAAGAAGHGDDRRADPGRRPAGHPRPGAVRGPGPAGRRGGPARRAADPARHAPAAGGHAAVAGPAATPTRGCGRPGRPPCSSRDMGSRRARDRLRTGRTGRPRRGAGRRRALVPALAARAARPRRAPGCSRPPTSPTCGPPACSG